MPAGVSEKGGKEVTGRCLLAAVIVLAGGFLLVGVTTAAAVVTQPTVIEGPNAEGIVLGNVAMAPDGTGGLVFTKTVEGKSHAFASRYDGVGWGAPVRVDGEIPYEGSEPRIAAGNGGRLLVVWVAPVATTSKGELRRGLYSAAMASGAGGFGAPLLVDPNLKNGVGTDPSVVGAVPGKAIVAYRVVTHVFGLPGEFTTGVQLRPGDVEAEIRVARLEGDRWSRLGAINRNPAASMRAPSETNGPQVAIGATGRAVVAWQEPDSTGAARIWMRRVTGTTLGPVFLASPESFEGKPLTEDATAFSLAVTPTDRARLAARVEGSAGSPLHGPRIFLTSLGSAAKPTGAKPVGPELADGGGANPPAAPLGPPAIAAADSGGAVEGEMSLAFSTGASVQDVGVEAQGKLESPHAVSGVGAVPGGPVVATVEPEGGGVIAYEGADESGAPTVVVRQEFPGGELQTGLLYGPLGGSISGLTGAGTGSGDALLAFSQGESGQTAIVADRISAPPEGFSIIVPKHWVRPSGAKVKWAAPESAVGGFTFGLVVDGRMVRSNLTRQRIVPPPGALGSGVSKVRILAIDRLGGEVLSEQVSLRVDARPPTVRARLNRSSGKVVLSLKDAQSGLARGTIRVSFGDGSHARGRAILRHRYTGPGRYTIKVRARDRVRNLLSQRIEVAVR
jgi:hypothetical protein